MIDPMANLDGGGAGADAQQGSNEKDVIDIISLRFNLQRVEKIRSVMGIAAGCVAGICGLTGFQGLCKYIIKILYLTDCYVSFLFCNIVLLCFVWSICRCDISNEKRY